MDSETALDLRESLNELLKLRAGLHWMRSATPADLAFALTVEAAELQALFLWKTGDESSSGMDRREHIRAELADVAIYVLLLAHDLNIDLRAAIKAKTEANRLRFLHDNQD